MSKFYTGKDAVLSIAGNDQVKVTNWSLQAELDMLETTTLGDEDRSYTPGIRSYSGSATLLYYEDAGAGGRNDAARQIKRVVSTGAPSTAPVAFRFTLDGKAVAIDAFITSASYGATVGEVVSAQISFRGTGTALVVNI
jgi:hypothetical protein